MSEGRKGTRWRAVAALYVVALAGSYGYRLTRPTPDPLYPGQDSVTVRDSFERGDSIPVRIAYRELPADSAGAPVILLLHGSPLDSRTFNGMARFFSGAYRVIIPDLAGYGGSQRDVPDYGLESQAELMLLLMDEVGADRFHVVGYSFGGGVGIVLADRAPDRVASLVLLSAIGVQEFELLGDYYVNHMLHGTTLLGVGFLTYAFPHFGVMDGSMLNIEFARSFYDSDQRPLRAMLERLSMPTLIIHGEDDTLVPVQAAREHYRIVPHSEFDLFEGGHGLVFRLPDQMDAVIEGWVGRVESGDALVRSQADPERVAQAAVPIDAMNTAPLSGPLLGLIVLLIVVGTLISEDLTLIAAGLLAARGSISILAAMSASFVGILLGDIFLYVTGRWFGRLALNRAPLRWFVRTADLDRSRRWMERNNPSIILSSRFVPGARLPTYFGAGVIRARFAPFFLYCVIAGAIWTPLLIWVAYVAGGRAWRYYAAYSGNALLALVATIVILYVGIRLIVAMASVRGRRRIRTRWRKVTSWEFWPPWAAYAPVIPYILFLALKHRSLTVFTAANPAMPGGGFVGESKSEILSGLSGDEPDSMSGDAVRVARFRVIPEARNLEERTGRLAAAMSEWRVTYPVVLKPDVGERGRGVAVVWSEDEARAYFAEFEGAAIVQEHVPGVEFGVFYVRMPGDERGRIFSITEKKPTCVEGDGETRLETLILDDKRAACLASVHLEQNSDRLDWVPEAGEIVRLTELGTHCRGALFVNGNHLNGPELERAFDEISRRFEGFYFGRYDVRVPSVDDFKAGRNVRVIELNGVTSEATHIYDPNGSAFEAYRVLFEQWRLAFDIGAANRILGVEPTTLRELMGALLHHYHEGH